MQYLINLIKEADLDFLKGVDFEKIPTVNIERIDVLIEIYETRVSRIQRHSDILEGGGNVMENYRLLSKSEIRQSIKEQKKELKRFEDELKELCLVK